MPETSEQRVIAADFVLASVGGQLRAVADGGVRVGADGRVVAVGPVADVADGLPVTRLDGCVLTPGLINAHTHLDLSYWAGQTAGLAGKPLHDWVVPVAGGRFMQPPDAIAKSAADGARASLAAGVTTVVDVTPGSIAWADVLAAVAEVPIRRVALAEVIGYGDRGRSTFADGLAALDRAAGVADRLLGVGLSPHAPYSTGPRVYHDALMHANRTGCLLMTHLAETPEEAEFLRTGGGPWRKRLAQFGVSAGDISTPGCSPVQYAVRLGLLDHAPTLLAHVNYLEPGDLDRLAATAASVAFCPRTHAFFGHAPHPWREMLAAGVNVTIGTDSPASSPDLSVLGELAFLRREFPDVPAVRLFDMATRAAARAIGRERDVGTLARGAYADIAAWPAAGDDAESLLAGVIDANAPPVAVFVGGHRIEPEPSPDVGHA